MQSEEQANQQELHSCYASEDEMIMTEEIKQVLDEQSKEIWKEIEEKLFDEFMNEFMKHWQETISRLSK